MSTKDRMIYCAGREAGYRDAHLARARYLAPGSQGRKTLVNLARQANRDRLAYIKAARSEK
jgi:hypothetical protein